MVVAGFDRYDLYNTPIADGATFTIWFAGCTHGCKGCQNTVLWDKNNGTHFTSEELLELVLTETQKTNIKSVTLLGGEPLQQDINELSALCAELNLVGKTIWVYTGYTYDEAREIAPQIFEFIDYIKCGKYEEELRQEDGSFPITSNQELWHNNGGNWVRIK